MTTGRRSVWRSELKVEGLSRQNTMIVMSRECVVRYLLINTKTYYITKIAIIIIINSFSQICIHYLAVSTVFDSG